MWKVMIRGAMTFAFSVFGRKVIALLALIALLFATSILIDLKMYVSAGLATVLSIIALIVFAIQYRRQVVANRLRAQRQADAAQRRAAASEARSERVGRAKATVAETVKGMTAGAADTVKGMTAGATGAARSSFAGARDRVQGWRK